MIQSTSTRYLGDKYFHMEIWVLAAKITLFSQKKCNISGMQYTSSLSWKKLWNTLGTTGLGKWVNSVTTLCHDRWYSWIPQDATWLVLPCIRYGRHPTERWEATKGTAALKQNRSEGAKKVVGAARMGTETKGSRSQHFRSPVPCYPPNPTWGAI